MTKIKKQRNSTLAYLTVIGLVLFLAGIITLIFYERFFANRIHLFLIGGVAVIILLFGILFAILATKGKIRHKPDYYTFFVMGIIWLPFGIIMDNSALWIMGLIFTIAGLANRKKWKKNHRRWKDLTLSEKKLKTTAIVVGSVTLIVGLIVFFLVR